MATHQELSGSSDEEFLQRLVSGYPERYGADFWAMFAAHIAPALPPHPVIIDLGCGPGLLLRDLAERYPQATLFGYDVTPAMIAYGQQSLPIGTRTTLAVHDVATQPLPHADGTVHLVTMTSVLHIVDEPLPVLAEVRRVLAPGGLFVLHEWIRMPLPVYFACRQQRQREDPDVSRQRGFRLFPVHNKYTTEDWQWLLGEAGFVVRHQTQLRPTHQLFVTTPAPKAEQR
ncbi:MAG TPA: class I SAM-dependent methyltransferase [Candidatus Tectomicrobia bacterium]|nr:class I SAM-dependent methyltransferase [Candidatus Tectomicrobia bacterium]